MSDITLELIPNYPAWAKKLAPMYKQFDNEYEGATKCRHMNRKELIEKISTDIAKGYLFWIKRNNKIIGYALAPANWTDEEGEPKTPADIKHRYLDTRWIMPEYRGRGYGTQAYKILFDEYNCMSTRLTLYKMYMHSKFLQEHGFLFAVPCRWVDISFAGEDASMYQDMEPSEAAQIMHMQVYHKNILVNKDCEDPTKEIEAQFGSSVTYIDNVVKRLEQDAYIG